MYKIKLSYTVDNKEFWVEIYEDGNSYISQWSHKYEEIPAKLKSIYGAQQGMAYQMLAQEDKIMGNLS